MRPGDPLARAQPWWQPSPKSVDARTRAESWSGVRPTELLVEVVGRESMGSTEALQRLLKALPADALSRSSANADAATGFSFTHLGLTPLKIGAVCQAFDPTELSPPRSGHLGNWIEIASGRAGAADFNNPICMNGRFGHVLAYDLTQTETEDLSKGDLVHMPGSELSRGKRRVLPLLSYHRDSWVVADRSHP